MIEGVTGTGVPGDAKVAIVAGSESNLKIMAESEMFEILNHAGISFELHIISADRNPNEIDEFCDLVVSKGKVEVVITVAGLAAVLSSAIKVGVGIIPVLAAPLDDESLSSNINKPKGVAIGVCGVNGVAACYNTTMLACEIVASGDPFIAEKLKAYVGVKRAEKSAQFCIDSEEVKKKYLIGENKR